MPTDEPPPEDQRFRVLDARFWSAIAFLVLCLIAAVVVAVWGPKIWPKAPPHRAPAAAPGPATVSRRVSALPLGPEPR
jgi:peptidoglycan/LPS O-acetylase OafA/YrhL